MSANLHNWQGKADYRDMRCLYCGKELALLKRLTGSEFCSDTHKQSYQDEYNRLALSRLLQAQSKSDEIKGKSSQAAPAVKQPETEPEPASQRTPASEVKPSPEFKSEPGLRPEPEPIIPKVKSEPELVASRMAGFFDSEKPPVRNMAFGGEPLRGAPLDWPANPSMPGLPAIAAARTEGPALTMAELVALDLRPPSTHSEQRRPATGSVPQAAHREFSSNSLNMEIPIRPCSSNGLRWAEPVPLTVAARVPVSVALELDERTPEFRFELGFHESARLELALTGIELPPEDAEVTVPKSGGRESEVPETNGTPRGALQALAKLHKAIKEENARGGRNEDKDGAGEPVRDDEPVIDSTELERLFGKPPRVPAHAPRQERPLRDDRGSVGVAVSESEVAPLELEMVGVARVADQLLTMPVKLVPPAKARVAAGFPALTPQPEPEMPRSDALPLRPKVAINTAAAAPPPKVEESEPSAAPTAKKADSPALKATGQPAPEVKAALETVKPVRSVSIPTPPPAPSRKPAAPKKETPPKETASPVAAPPKPKDPEPAPAAERPMELDAPHLMLTSSSGGSFGALSGKTKIMAALVAILIVAILGYLSFGGSKTAGRASSADAIATSIMMGEGGWVTNWAGDSTGLHRGRQITIYRPSLKLSDCRIEFQGRIISNSVGWVFRAVDSGNYYAMKVTLSSGYKLQKYAVINGQEHYLGQVALTAPSGGMFSIRVDVRGPRFSTYIQGQPVDIWTDNQLKSGAVGFLNDRGDRAEIKGVAISYLTGVGN